MTAKRVALIGFQVLLAVLVGLAIRELWLSRSGDDAAAREAPETLAVSARITPDVHTFGEPVVATVEVVADAGFIKPDTVRVETDFAPYELAGEPTVEREVDRRRRARRLHVPAALSPGGLRRGRGARRRAARAGIRPLPLRRGLRARDGTSSTGRRSRSPRASRRRRSSSSAGARARRRSRPRPRASARSGSPCVLLAIAAALVGIGALARSAALADASPRASSRRTRGAALAARAGARPRPRRLAQRRRPRRTGGGRSSGSRASSRTVGQDGLAGDARALAWAPGPAVGRRRRRLRHGASPTRRERGPQRERVRAASGSRALPTSAAVGARARAAPDAARAARPRRARGRAARRGASCSRAT